MEDLPITWRWKTENEPVAQTTGIAAVATGNAGYEERLRGKRERGCPGEGYTVKTGGIFGEEVVPLCFDCPGSASIAHPLSLGHPHLSQQIYCEDFFCERYGQSAAGEDEQARRMLCQRPEYSSYHRTHVLSRYFLNRRDI